MGVGLHDFCTVFSAYKRFYWSIYLQTCEAIIAIQWGHTIHPLDLTKSNSSTFHSTKVPSLMAM
jgi:hypothetical protein